MKEKQNYRKFEHVRKLTPRYSLMPRRPLSSDEIKKIYETLEKEKEKRISMDNN